jgi:hypothetical protein
MGGHPVPSAGAPSTLPRSPTAELPVCRRKSAAHRQSWPGGNSAQQAPLPACPSTWSGPWKLRPGSTHSIVNPSSCQQHCSGRSSAGEGKLLCQERARSSSPLAKTGATHEMQPTHRAEYWQAQLRSGSSRRRLQRCKCCYPRMHRPSVETCRLTECHRGSIVSFAPNALLRICHCPRPTVRH